MNNGAVFKLFSIPENVSPANYGPTGFSLNFVGGVPNQDYQILASTDLIHWGAIATVTSDENGSFQYLDTTAGGYQTRFYRTLGP